MSINRASLQLIVAIVSFVLLPSASATAQTPEEIAEVTRKMGRPQTNASTLSYLAGLHTRAKDYDKAIQCYKKLLTIYESDPGLGADSPKYIWAQSQMAACMKSAKKQKDADELCRRALLVLGGRTTQTDPFDADYISNALADCESVLGKAAFTAVRDANTALPEPVLRGISVSEIPDVKAREEDAAKKVEDSRKHAHDFQYAKNLLYLANILTIENRFDEADPFFQDAIKIGERRFGALSPKMLVPLSNYGYMLEQCGRHQEAQQILDRMKNINLAGP